MAESLVQSRGGLSAGNPQRSELIRTEDWWAIWIGLGLIAAAVGLFSAGASLKWLAVAPQKWSHGADWIGQLRGQGVRYFGTFPPVGHCVRHRRRRSRHQALEIRDGVRGAVCSGGGDLFSGPVGPSAHYNLEPPLVALGLGLLISNTIGVPGWLEPALRVEFTSRRASCCWAQGLPLTLLAWAGPWRCCRPRSFRWRPSASSISAP